MINFVKVNEGTKINIPVKDYESCYKLMKDDKTIGYGTINQNEENKLYIFVDEQERGKGYGDLLFSKILEETKNKGYNEAQISFNRNNMPMVKIATHNGGIYISSDGDTVRYVIPTK